MRRFPALLLSAALLPLPVALPVLTAPQPHVHAVAPSLHTTRLAVPAGVAQRAVLAARAHRPAAERTLVLTGQDRTQRFSTVGVTWARDAAVRGLEVQVRTRSNGRWTGWQDLGGTYDAAPDSASPDSHSAGLRGGTQPLYVGPSDGVQARVVLTSGAAPRDLRVDLVDPGVSAADATLGQPQQPASTAAAAAAKPTIITRAQWGADESLRYKNGCDGVPSYSPTVLMGFVHHTETTNDYTMDEAAAQIRGIYAYHVLSNGWCDIGYNFLVDRYGRVFEGRYGGVDKPVIGAHTGGFNYNSFAASLLGSFTSVTPPAAMQTALEKLFAWKLSLTYRNPLGKSVLTAGTFSGSRYAAGTKVTFNTVSGHRDADYTSCPGDVAYSLLPTFRSRIAAYLGAGLVNPQASRSHMTIGTPDILNVTSGVVSSQSWRASVVRVADGAVVRSATGSTSGTISVTFDGRDGSGVPVVPGKYTFRLETWNGTSTGRPWEWPFTVDVTAPDILSTAPGSFDLFSNDVGGSIVHRWSTTNGATWSAPTSLGGVAIDRPAAVGSGSDLQVFVTGTTRNVYRKVRSGGTWSSWASIGGSATSGPAAVSSPAGTDVFVRGTDGAVWTQAAGTTSWTSLGGAVLGAPAAVSPAPGVVQVFVTGTNSVLYVNTRTEGSWSGWTRLGGAIQAGPGAAAAPGTSRTDVFVRNAVGTQLSRLTWTATSGWSAFQALSGDVASSPSATATAQPGDTTGATTTVDVVAVQPDGSLGRWTFPAGGTAKWSPLFGAAVVTPTIDSITPSPQLAGQTVTIVGHAQPSAAVSLFGRTPTATSDSLLATTTSDGSGRFSVSRGMTYNTVVHVTTAQGDSSTEQVGIREKVTISSVSQLGVDPRGRCIVQVYGGTYPFVPGAPVYIRTTSGSPVGVGTVVQYGGSGRYTSKFTLPCHTTTDVNARSSGTGSDGVVYTLDGISPSVSVRTP